MLGYFGEGFEPPCGNCDNCDAGHSEGVREEDVGLVLGDRVVHEAWGEGTVGQIADGQITVVFESVGYKTLAAELVAERGLLRKVA